MNYYPPPELPASAYYYTAGGVAYITPKLTINKEDIKFLITVRSGYGLPFITTSNTGEPAVSLNGTSGFNILARLESSYKSYTTTSCPACGMQAGPPQNLVSHGAVFYHISNTGGLTDFYNQMGYYSGDAAMLYNEGTISGTLQNEGSAEGAVAEIWNSGTLNIISNAATGMIEGKTAAIINLSDGYIRSLTNNGTLSGGQYAVVNQGRLDSLTNTGTMTGGIINYGTITGNVALGSAKLIFAGDSAKVGGVISWNGDKDVSVGHGSKVAVGDNTESASYTADGSVYAENIAVASGSKLIISQEADWHALATQDDAFSNAGTLVMNSDSILSGNLTNSGTLIMGDQQYLSATLSGDMVNSGKIVLNPTSYSAGNTLTINGNYTGTEGSVISLGSVLADDDSLTDKLVITGDTTGSSILNIFNENGSGAQTLRGIQVVSVGGKSDGIFILGNRVVAGAYDYSLHKGSLADPADDKGWYLTSAIPQPNPTVPNEPTVVVPLTPDLPEDAEPALMVRPETGAYTDNLKASRSLFNVSLHDRSAGIHTTSMWIRNEGGRNKTELSDGQNTTTAKRYVMQIGGDVLTWESGKGGKAVLGVMGGYAVQHGSTHNHLTDHGAKNSVSGYSTGLYGTWYQNWSDKSGLFIDSWLQHGWFNNEVKGEDLSPETYKSRGLSASLEIGYSQHLATFLTQKERENSIWLQPHAQVIWAGVKANDHTEQNGTDVQGTGSDNVLTRLGLRAYLDNRSLKDNDKANFRPFIEANWVYNSKNDGVRMNDEQVGVDGGHNTLEMKAGVEGKLNRNLSVWASVTQQLSGKGYNDTEGTLGLRYQF
ncbi:autotransporter outer membrane beta-barrel domain-containing protein [Serratia symbiotica]|uniref:autotransporter outer membrane beta-barrel domain-containing protein n=1 Tax=Serratia symbiotica TaxID=138074 RepID=UPI0013290C17|nr:autotransporter outer membrane beta-barrel domain-containing protein [Serratia symbiotica]MBF1994065.1 autotransporter outer membrane beta-barrel domain-containing protein [Serratia symbiotica]QTP15699.1 autotransporter outer membrane beta-barrel domain-containing protein [Serratia symbiotica]